MKWILKIVVEGTGQAFEDCPEEEAAAILRKISDTIQGPTLEDTWSWQPILDTNGNRCGRWRWFDDDYDGPAEPNLNKLSAQERHTLAWLEKRRNG